MSADDVQQTLDIALEKTGVTQVKVKHRPRLLSDNGPALVSKPLADYLKRHRIQHVRGAPYHPQTQGKIERYHRSMKSIVKLDNYYTPSQLEQAIEGFVDYYNNHRYHEALDNITPADKYSGREQDIQTRRDFIKQQTLAQRRLMNLQSLPYTL